MVRVFFGNLKGAQWPRARSGLPETSGPWEEDFWGGCTVEKFNGEALWLQEIQDSVENIMEKREERADSGEDAECRIIERERERESGTDLCLCLCASVSDLHILKTFSILY